MSSSEAQASDEDDLGWAAMPTFDRMRKGVLEQMLDDGQSVESEIDVQRQKRVLVDHGIHRAVEEDNENFLRRLRDRIDRVGMKVPKIEIRFKNLRVEGEVHVGGRALPTLLNATFNFAEAVLGLLGLSPSKKKVIKILKGVNGIVKPSRMTLLLGPPGAGKTTLLMALAGKLDKNLMVNGKVSYCGHEFHEFIPQRTCAYISQHDLHLGEMTVRETLNFAGQCLGVGARHGLLAELARREKEAGIIPEPDIDAYMKSISIEGQRTSYITDYVIKMLGLDLCVDTMIGNEMIRGISGGQKKRVTSGEMLVGPFKALMIDELSNGLDSSTTLQICKYLKQMAHVMGVTTIVSLLQPTPETYELFDDVILLSEGQIVYQGACENVLKFFESVGFRCPKRKGVADFLQEVTSRKDQGQYWSRRNKLYRFISIPEFAEAFKSFYVGEQLELDLNIPYDKSMTQKDALVQQKYGLSNWDLLKACFSRELLLMKRNSSVYIFNLTQITILSLITMTLFYRTTMPHKTAIDGEKYYGALYFSLIKLVFNGFTELALTVLRLPVFFKQRDTLFYPSWAYALPIWILRIPVSLVESGMWVILTYYTIGYAPAISRIFGQFLAFFSIHQMALSLYLLLGVVGRTMVIANIEAILCLMLMLSLGGFIIAKDDIPTWMIWGYYASPAMYGQSALVINEFLDKRWSFPNNDPRVHQSTVGKVLLASRGFVTDKYWYWVSIGVLFGFTLLFNVMYILALKYLNPYADSRAISFDDGHGKLPSKQEDQHMKMVTSEVTRSGASKRGMLLQFQPLSVAFNHVNYFVDMPKEIMKVQGVQENRLQLLRDVSGSFRPGILTALVGVSGAGKTTLLDVLAGRKTSGYIEGSVYISGYPKKQETFARICGYCEQTDVHSPNLTLYESLLFSAWLRLPCDVCTETRKMFVDEVMDLVELNPLRNALVGLPGVSGLSTEQRKRLTIAVELVANPSIIFMDEPTSGLDARAAAIVMRTVRKTVNTGRTVVCTIHQPSIDIFEAFDELLFLKMGGQIIYAGPLGHHSNKLIEYFEAIPGVPKIPDSYNPATWMLEITTLQLEVELGVDFAEHYANSPLYRSNQDMILELSTTSPGFKDLEFPTAYSQPFITQCRACFWKQYWSYWRNPPYNAMRFLMTIIIGLFVGLLFWKNGGKLDNMLDLINLFGALFAAPFFLGSLNTWTVLTVIAVERTAFYRERAARMYSSLAYTFAQVAVEILYVLIQTFVFSILMFSMIGFEWTTKKFFYFYYFMFMCFTYLTLFGMMLMALTPNEQIGAVFMSFLTGLWSLFAGFLIPLPQIPVWWRWYFWTSPMAWTLYGLATSQLGDKNTPLAVLGENNMTVKTFLESRYGFHYDFLPFVVVAHVGWVFLFMLVFVCGIKFLNFQKR